MSDHTHDGEMPCFDPHLESETTPQKQRTDFRRATDIAKSFHYSYSLFAPALNWKEQEGTAVAWEDLPEANRNLMVVVAVDLLNRGLIR